MIKILCLARNVSEILAIKKRIQDEIFACKELPAYQRWVRPGDTFYPMRTENCEIDFRLPNPDKTGGLSVDLVYGVFDCDYSDELINILTGRRSLGLQKKYGKSELPIWEIILDIEKRYARVTEGMFKEENNERSCGECKQIDTCKDKIDVRTVEDDIKYGMVVPYYVPGPDAECLVEDRSEEP